MGVAEVYFQCKKGCKVVRNKGCPHCDCSKQDAKTTPPRRFRATKLFKPPQKPAGKTTKKSDDKKKTTKKPAAKTTKNIGWKVNMQDNQEQVAVNTDVIFTWTGTHDVYLLPNKKAFEECDFSKAKELASTKVNKYTYKASAAGVFYFACKVTGHCKFTKQKLALTVTPAAGKGKVEETSVTSCTGKGKKRVCKTIVTRRLCTGEGKNKKCVEIKSTAGKTTKKSAAKLSKAEKKKQQKAANAKKKKEA